jgi:hypothetical protein
MFRGVLITLGVLSLGAPAMAQSASSANPFRVTWDANPPALIDPFTDPLPLTINDSADLQFGRTRPLRAPIDQVGGAEGAWIVEDEPWTDAPQFHVCAAADQTCADRLPNAFGLRLRPDGSGGLKLGALVRLGEHLKQPRTTSRNAWRFFAAADAHAVTWDLDRNDDETLRVEDHLMLGDAQVGVARPLGPGDLSLGVTQREVKAAVGRDGFSRTEQFAGITFSMKH